MHSKISRFLSLVATLSTIAAMLIPFSTAEAQQPAATFTTTAQGTHPAIVVYKDAAAASLARVQGQAEAVRQNLQQGNRLTHTYTSAVTGYAGKVTDQELAALKADPNVSVIPDIKISVYDTLKTPKPDALLSALRFKTAGTQILPSGVDRIEADRSLLFGRSSSAGFNSGLSVLVVDTGVASHPDLNLDETPGNGVDCITGTNDIHDQFGHGTHVAGIIGAKNNTTGVVGVAPGVRIISGRMFDANGSGTFGAFICVLDWAVQNAARLHIVAANMSLSGGQLSDGTTCANTFDGIHLSVCRLIQAGVVPVVAAGNDGHDFVNNIPANYPDVLTVTGYNDADGKPGNDFSAGFNFATAGTIGDKHEIAAPSVNILSTYLGGGYASLSGTSMAAPHVTGTVVSCIYAGRCTGTPVQIIQTLLRDASRTATSFGFVGDNNRPQGNMRFGYTVTNRPN